MINSYSVIFQWFKQNEVDVKVDKSDWNMLDDLDDSYPILEGFDKLKLIAIIKKQRKIIDNLRDIQRNDDGEEIIGDDDQPVDDGETYL